MVPTTAWRVGMVFRRTFVTKTGSNHRLSNNHRITCFIPDNAYQHRTNGDEHRRKPNERRFLTGVSIGTWFAFFGLQQHEKDRKKHEKENSTIPNGDKRIIPLAEVQKHKSFDDGGIWVVFQGKVYDVTKFVELHPGGDKILLAAGSDVAPFWGLYAFHYEQHVLEILNEYYIGDLPESDINLLGKEDRSGPYANDPKRHPALIVLTKEPMNAETPSILIPGHPITPNELFFVRNHLPVPDIDVKEYKLEIKSPNLLDKHGKPFELSMNLDELKQNYPIHSIVSTVVCAGNRRSQMAKEDRKKAETAQRKPFIRGLDWKNAALSTAEWTGVRLVDVLAHHLLPDQHVTNYNMLLEAAQKAKIRHIHFDGADVDKVIGSAYGASMPIEWALDPQMDVLLAFEMNGEPIPRDHGFPVRVIVPGSIGARQVKWLTKITLSTEESSSFYQQEDYKVGYVFGDDHHPDYTCLPAIFDYPVQSAICDPQDGTSVLNEGSLTIRGYAFSGGGRGILSVRVSSDNGKTWHNASLQPVSLPVGIDPAELPPGDLAMAHRTRRQWAWTLWEAELPVPKDAKEMEIVCCARDSSNSVQPETCEASLNVRGLMANNWHRIHVYLVNPDEE